MNKRILITDSLFIYDEHIKQLESRGFLCERLDKPQANEAELCEAIRGKHGYILGGIERVTDAVIDAADVLEVIAFTGSGYAEFIPAYEKATRRGIAISAAVGGNALDVAEFTIGLIFEMVRNFPLLRTPKSQGGKGFFIARRIKGLTLGVVGYGHVGKEVVHLAKQVGMKVLVYSRNKQDKLPSGCESASLKSLLQSSDIVSLHVSKSHGNDVIGEKELNLMKRGAIVINAAFPEAIDCEALRAKLEAKELRAAFDAPAPGDFNAIDLGIYSTSNSQTAFNTAEANQEISDRTTMSLINLMESGKDKDLVNPNYKRNRK